MDTARQILRYSIPGSLCLITAVAVVFIMQVAAAFDVTAISPATKVETTIAMVAASVPVGFLIYQVYYASYGPLVPYRWLVFWTRTPATYITRDRGADIFRQLPDDQLVQLRSMFDAALDVDSWYLQADARTRLAKAANLMQLDEQRIIEKYRNADHPPDPVAIYELHWRENWGVFRSLLDLAAARADAKELKMEFTTLSDIYHALGAARLAVPLGGVIGVVYAGSMHTERILHHLLEEFVAAMLMALVGAWIVNLLHNARRATWNSALACAQYGLRWCLGTHPDGLASLQPADGTTTLS